MKFIVAVVLHLALAATFANSSVIPLGGQIVLSHLGQPTLTIAGPSVVGGQSLTVSGPIPVASPGSIAVHATPQVLNLPVQVVAPHTVVAGTQTVVAAPHTVVAGTETVVAAPTVIAAPSIVPGASYVAQTRGAVHVAPLPGHANSASSVNLQPAPGTV